jgi:hypothetical protein
VPLRTHLHLHIYYAHQVSQLQAGGGSNPGPTLCRTWDAMCINESQHAMPLLRPTSEGTASEFLAVSPHVSCSARNADSPERRLAVGLKLATTVKADCKSALRTGKCEICGIGPARGLRRSPRDLPAFGRKPAGALPPPGELSWEPEYCGALPRRRYA